MVRVSAVAPERETIALEEFFDGDELRLRESHGGWMGFRREDGRYYFVDTRAGAAEWLQHVRVGTDAVRETIKRTVLDAEDAGRRGGAA